MAVEFWGPSNIPFFNLASENWKNWDIIYWKQYSSLSSACTNCFMRPNLMWRSGRRTFDGCTNGSLMTFLDPLSSDILFGLAFFFYNDYHDPDCPISTKNKDTLYFLIVVREALKELWNCNKAIYVVRTWFCFQYDFHFTVNFSKFCWISYWYRCICVCYLCKLLASFHSISFIFEETVLCCYKHLSSFILLNFFFFSKLKQGVVRLWWWQC